MAVIEIELADGLLNAEARNNRPLRSRASTRSSCTHSYRSTPTEVSPITPTKWTTSTSGRASPITGKARTLTGNVDKLSSQTSWRNAGIAKASHLDIELLKDRLASRDFTPEPERIFDVSFLEPRPYERVKTNLTEIITAQPGSIRDSTDLTGFGGHRDTFAILAIRRKQRQDIELPASFFEHLIPYITFEMYLAIRLSCRSWSATISEVRPLWRRAVSLIPVEVLEQIYYYMLPVDFNAARHTCRAWMVASLEARLLTYMLKRGGWWTAALADQATIAEDLHDSMSGLEWLLSKRLATECTIHQDWSCNGLGNFEDIGLENVSRQPALTLNCELDLSDLSNDFVNDAESLPLQLVPSICGRYLLVFRDHNIWVLHLGGDSAIASHSPSNSPQALQTFSCPQRVLAISMDTSSGSYSIAVLLQGCVGLVRNLLEESRTTSQFAMPKVRLPTWVKSPKRESNFLDDEIEIELPLPSTSLVNDTKSPRNPWAHEELPFTISPERYDNSPPSRTKRLAFQHLCSVGAPPLSVAICPQRPCVAFGCSAGIELHWKELASDQGLNRWFPSHISSEHLYFLPARLDDTARQLRLISSEASPSQKANILQRVASEQAEHEENATVWESMSDLGLHDCGQRNTDKPGYYHAKPCSDGWHVLFLDAESGDVCLGIDNQDGQTVGERLSRMATFLRPDKQTYKPTCYAVSTELSWGPRVVVGYDDGSIYMFSVPVDIFLAGRGGSLWDWLETWDAYTATNEGGSGFAVWPIEVKGIKVGDVEGLVDVAIQGEAGGVGVWAFSSHGKGFSWGLDVGRQGKASVCRALNDELGFRIEDERDEDGDWRMRDVPLLRAQSGFDGAASQTRIADTHPFPEARSSDVPMQDASEDEGYCSTPEDDPTDLEIPTRSRKRLYHAPLLHRSDVSMQDDHHHLSTPTIPPPLDTTTLLCVDPPPSNPPNKRRRLDSSPSPTRRRRAREGLATKAERGFDPDRQTIEWVSSAFAISVPGLERRWSGSDVEGQDWVPDFAEMDEGESGGMDLWATGMAMAMGEEWDVDIL